TRCRKGQTCAEAPGKSTLSKTAANAPAVTSGIDVRRIDAGTPSQASVDKPISCVSRYWPTAVRDLMSTNAPNA
ncbi:hypothetical protein K4A07_16635, partial [Lactiplantibacillus plantarum]|nr:hypothetical protein [Lactiplantibacillus plantarum]